MKKTQDNNLEKIDIDISIYVTIDYIIMVKFKDKKIDSYYILYHFENKIRLLNHKWILTDFTDGKYWGEMIMTYEITDKQELKFKLLDHLLYH